MSDQELLDRAVAMFVAATPPVGAPIEDWRTGFEEMCANFEVPADAVVEEVQLGGVPGRRICAPGVDTSRVVLHFHSGGYVMGSSRAYREFAYRLSKACNAAVIVPDYRLAPEAPYPAAVEDGAAAYRALLKEIDPGRVVISGDSAGGGLAIATLMVLRDEGIPLPKASFTISPLLDLAGTGESAETNAGADPLIDRNMVVEMGKVYIGERDPKATPLASPLYGKHEGLPPLLLLASNSEVLRDDAVRLAESVNASGGNAKTLLPDGMVHIWTLFPFLSQAERSVHDIGEFVRGHLG